MNFAQKNWSSEIKDGSSSHWIPFLRPLSFLYGLGIKFRLSAYKRGLLRKNALPGCVVSIGNLSVGGTGKTPAAAMIAKWALGEGLCVAILSRGYGGNYSSKVFEVSDGKRIIGDPLVCGDEPYLLARNLPGVPVVLSKKRSLAGQYAYERFGSDFFILDDGFQHLSLERDLNLALIDAVNPFGNGRLLPLGPLREPVDELDRADAFIVTRFGEHGMGGRVMDFLKQRFPLTPIFCAEHLPEKVIFPHQKAVYDPGFLNGKRVLAFAGIAQPEGFKATLLELGADVIHFRGFRDHHPFRRKEMETLTHLKEETGAHFLITTEKDWARLSGYGLVFTDLAYLSIRFALLYGGEGLFKMIKERIRRRT